MEDFQPERGDAKFLLGYFETIIDELISKLKDGSFESVRKQVTAFLETSVEFKQLQNMVEETNYSESESSLFTDSNWSSTSTCYQMQTRDNGLHDAEIVASSTESEQTSGFALFEESDTNGTNTLFGDVVSMVYSTKWMQSSEANDSLLNHGRTLTPKVRMISLLACRNKKVSTRCTRGGEERSIPSVVRVLQHM